MALALFNTGQYGIIMSIYAVLIPYFLSSDGYVPLGS